VVSFSQVAVASLLAGETADSGVLPCCITDWSKADTANKPNIINYQKDQHVLQGISEACLPAKQFISTSEHISCGWNEYVQGKRTAAHAAFLHWVSPGPGEL
jgi:hypothetical protein